MRGSCCPMKRKKGLVILLIFICLTSYLVWFLLPREINQTFDGFLYGLGDKKSHIKEKVTITVNGKFRKKVFNQDRFKGVIDIKGNVPSSIIIDKKEVEIVFNSDNSGSIHFNDYSQPTHLNSYGTLYINNDFSQLTIGIYEQEDSDTYSWSAKDGLMISAPASNREVALIISNQLMKKLLRDWSRKSLDDY